MSCGSPEKRGIIYISGLTSSGLKISQVHILAHVKAFTLYLYKYLLVCLRSVTDVLVFQRYFIQIYLSRATSWTRLTFDPPKVQIGTDLRRCQNRCIINEIYSVSGTKRSIRNFSLCLFHSSLLKASEQFSTRIKVILHNNLCKQQQQQQQQQQQKKTNKQKKKNTFYIQLPSRLIK